MASKIRECSYTLTYFDNPPAIGILAHTHISGLNEPEVQNPRTVQLRFKYILGFWLLKHRPGVPQRARFAETRVRVRVGRESG